MRNSRRLRSLGIREVRTGSVRARSHARHGALAVILALATLGGFTPSAFAYGCFGNGLPTHYYTGNRSGYPAKGTRIETATPYQWSVDSTSNPPSAMNEAAWIIDHFNAVNSIEVGYFSGRWPDGSWFNGLLPYYTLKNGQTYVRGTTYLTANYQYFFEAVAGGRATVKHYSTVVKNWTFSYAVANGENYSQGEVLFSTRTWLGAGDANRFTGSWTPDGTSWYEWGSQSKCQMSPYWDIFQSSPADWVNGGY